MEKLLTALKKYWYSLALILFAVLISFILWFTNRNISSTFTPSVSQAVAQDEKDSCSLHIDISGAVTNPNVYCLPEGSLIIDAVKKAGGFKKDLYAKEYIQANINLSQKLEPNQKVYIPFKNEFKYLKYRYDLVPILESEKLNKEPAVKECVSLNNSTLEDLDTLKGVGESLAQKIIDARPYKSIEDLNLVSGIGDSLFSNIKDSVCI